MSHPPLALSVTGITAHPVSRPVSESLVKEMLTHRYAHTTGV